MEELIIIAVLIGVIWMWVYFSKKDAERYANEDIYVQDTDPFEELNKTVAALNPDAVAAVELDPIEELELQLIPGSNQILDEIQHNITERQAEQRKRTAPARVEYLKRKLALIQAAKELQKFAQENNLPE